jgi:hypothetical protein
MSLRVRCCPGPSDPSLHHLPAFGEVGDRSPKTITSDSSSPASPGSQKPMLLMIPRPTCAWPTVARQTAGRTRLNQARGHSLRMS